jgi:hypothetical protein
MSLHVLASVCRPDIHKPSHPVIWSHTILSVFLISVFQSYNLFIYLFSSSYSVWGRRLPYCSLHRRIVLTPFLVSPFTSRRAPRQMRRKVKLWKRNVRSIYPTIATSTSANLRHVKEPYFPYEGRHAQDFFRSEKSDGFGRFFYICSYLVLYCSGIEL